MEPTRPPFVSTLWSFASSNCFARGRPQSVMLALSELLAAHGALRRRKSFRAWFAQARQIDKLVGDLDSPPASGLIALLKDQPGLKTSQ
jgi:hypothetical protein